MERYDLQQIAENINYYHRPGGEKKKFEHALFEISTNVRKTIKIGLPKFTISGKLKGISTETAISFHPRQDEENIHFAVFCTGISPRQDSNEYIYEFVIDYYLASSKIDPDIHYVCRSMPTSNYFGVEPCREIDHQALEEIRAGKGVDGNGIEKLD